MRRSLLSLAFILSLVLPAAVAAEDNGTVSAEVTVATPCILVGDPINYGTLGFSTAETSVFGFGETSYTNCSTESQRIYARGTDATSTTSATTWQLGAGTCTPGPNYVLDAYNHTVAVGNGNFQLADFADMLIQTGAPAGATQTLPTHIKMPCSGSAGAGETMTFSIILTATF